MARPTKSQDERRTAQLPPLRVTEAERVHVAAQAAKAGLGVTEYQRRRILGHSVTAKRTAADDRLLAELNRVGVNLNQIAKTMNAGRDMPHSLTAVLDELAALRATVEGLARGS
jgi:hypothetical protein